MMEKSLQKKKWFMAVSLVLVCALQIGVQWYFGKQKTFLMCDELVERQIIISINSTLFSLQILKQRRNHISKSRFHRCFSHNPVAYVRDWLLAAAMMISASIMVFPC